MSWYSRYPKYVPVAKRRKATSLLVEKLKKKGKILNPIVIEGRTISKTFWGKQWCKNLESYSDYENRLPRGRTYVRNGSVIDLHITEGQISALVSGSSIYTVNVTIRKVETSQWDTLIQTCLGKIESVVELLQGRFSKGVMDIIAQPATGLFPHPKEIHITCSCPDYAVLCKHAAAVLYGIGAHLDEQPESLFLLRKANPIELIGTLDVGDLSQGTSSKTLDGDLSSLFGVDLSKAETQPLRSSKKMQNQQTNQKSKNRD